MDQCLNNQKFLISFFSYHLLAFLEWSDHAIIISSRLSWLGSQLHTENIHSYEPSPLQLQTLYVTLAGDLLISLDNLYSPIWEWVFHEKV